MSQYVECWLDTTFKVRQNGWKIKVLNPWWPYSRLTMIQLHLSLHVCPLQSLKSSIFLAGSIPYTGTETFSADREALISLIINQYVAGSPSGDNVTQHWHLFSTNTVRDEVMKGGENKDKDITPAMGKAWRCVGGGGWVRRGSVGFQKFMLQNNNPRWFHLDGENMVVRKVKPVKN